MAEAPQNPSTARDPKPPRYRKVVVPDNVGVSDNNSAHTNYKARDLRNSDEAGRNYYQNEVNNNYSSGFRGQQSSTSGMHGRRQRNGYHLQRRHEYSTGTALNSSNVLQNTHQEMGSSDFNAFHGENTNVSNFYENKTSRASGSKANQNASFSGNGIVGDNQIFMDEQTSSKRGQWGGRGQSYTRRGWHHREQPRNQNVNNQSGGWSRQTTGRAEAHRNQDNSRTTSALSSSGTNDVRTDAKRINVAVSSPQKSIENIDPNEAAAAEDDDAEDLPISTDMQERRNDLIRALKNERYSCMICLDKVRRRHFVWSCIHCSNIYHMRCIQGWARVGRNAGASRHDAEQLDRQQTFRCPACQHENTGVPLDYYCFCGQEKMPEFSPFTTPHSCGQLCSRTVRNGVACGHRCPLVCHPGVCPPCTESIQASCPCGKTFQQIVCRNKETLTCGQTCGKRLECGRHSCQSVCHFGACMPCSATLNISCHCTKTSRDVQCASLTPDYYTSKEQNIRNQSFACDMLCDRLLACGKHHCREKCHAGACGECPRLPTLVRACACGKTPLTAVQLEARAKLDCTAPMATCQRQCDKKLLCGHKCAMKCHNGDCSVCDKTVTVSCRCKKSSRTIKCRNYGDESQWQCTKRCNKKLNCDRHRCERVCCAVVDDSSNSHGAPCDKVCNKKLTCGLHTCNSACGHRGPCPRCFETSFRPLSCYCGETVQEPPVLCGTAPPECSRPCTRMHACGHAPTHTCHSGSIQNSDPNDAAAVSCPPCVELVQRSCYGNHEKRIVPCHIAGISCGRPCMRALPCGMHYCNKPCHNGPCLAAGESCRQPCVFVRTGTCGHECGAPCHPNYRKCPTAFECRAAFLIRCGCMRLERRVACRQTPPRDHGDILCQPSLSSATTVSAEKYEASFTIKCDGECEKQAINRRFAQALNINTMDVSSKLPETSTGGAVGMSNEVVGGKDVGDFVREFYRCNATYCREAEQAVRACVQKTLQSSFLFPSTRQQQQQRNNVDPISKRVMPTALPSPPSHTFRPAPKDFRHFLHELAEMYKCESTSYTSDAGGVKKYIVTVARPGVCCMPFESLQDVMDRHVMVEVDKFRSLSAAEQRQLVKSKLLRVVSQYYSAPTIAAKLTSMLMQSDHVTLLHMIENDDSRAMLRKRTDECYELLKIQERVNNRAGGKATGDEVLGIADDGAAIFEKKLTTNNAASWKPWGASTDGSSSSAGNTSAVSAPKSVKKKKDYFDCDE